MTLEELKTKYGDIFEIKVGDKIGYFKKADYNAYSKSSDLYAIGDELEGDAELAKACFVGGDKEMIDTENHVNLFLSYNNKLNQLFEIYESECTDNKDGTYTIKCNGKSCKIKMPNLQGTKLCLSLFNSNKFFDSDKNLLKSGWIEGDNEFKDFIKNPIYFVSIRKHLSNLIQIQNSTLKKK